MNKLKKLFSTIAVLLSAVLMFQMPVMAEEDNTWLEKYEQLKNKEIASYSCYKGDYLYFPDELYYNSEGHLCIQLRENFFNCETYIYSCACCFAFDINNNAVNVSYYNKNTGLYDIDLTKMTYVTNNATLFPDYYKINWFFFGYNEEISHDTELSKLTFGMQFLGYPILGENPLDYISNPDYLYGEPNTRAIPEYFPNEGKYITLPEETSEEITAPAVTPTEDPIIEPSETDPTEPVIDTPEDNKDPEITPIEPGTEEDVNTPTTDDDNEETTTDDETTEVETEIDTSETEPEDNPIVTPEESSDEDVPEDFKEDEVPVEDTPQNPSDEEEIKVIPDVSGGDAEPTEIDDNTTPEADTPDVNPDTPVVEEETNTPTIPEEEKVEPVVEEKQDTPVVIIEEKKEKVTPKTEEVPKEEKKETPKEASNDTPKSEETKTATKVVENNETKTETVKTLPPVETFVTPVESTAKKVEPATIEPKVEKVVVSSKEDNEETTVEDEIVINEEKSPLANNKTKTVAVSSLAAIAALAAGAVILLLSKKEEDEEK